MDVGRRLLQRAGRLAERSAGRRGPERRRRQAPAARRGRRAQRARPAAVRPLPLGAGTRRWCSTPRRAAAKRARAPRRGPRRPTAPTRRATAAVGLAADDAGEHQPPGLGGGQRQLAGFAIAELADQQHVDVLARRRAQAGGDRRDVQPDLALDDDAAPVLEHDLDRILDGDDVGRMPRSPGRRSAPRAWSSCRRPGRPRPAPGRRRARPDRARPPAAPGCRAPAPRAGSGASEIVKPPRCWLM